MRTPKIKELSEQTKAEMRRGQRALRENHAIDFFGNMLATALGGKKDGWQINKKTYIYFDEKFKIFIDILPKNGDVIQIEEHEDDFPSKELIAQIVLLVM